MKGRHMWISSTSVLRTWPGGRRHCAEHRVFVSGSQARGPVCGCTCDLVGLIIGNGGATRREVKAARHRRNKQLHSICFGEWVTCLK